MDAALDLDDLLSWLEREADPVTAKAVLWHYRPDTIPLRWARFWHHESFADTTVASDTAPPPRSTEGAVLRVRRWRRRSVAQPPRGPGRKSGPPSSCRYGEAAGRPPSGRQSPRTP